MRYFSLCTILCSIGLVFAVKTHAQKNAGGNWSREEQKNALTDVPSIVFSLKANEGEGYLAFRCSGVGRFEEAWLDPGVVLDNSNTMPRGLVGGDQPNQSVRVRVDNKMKLHFWFVSADLRALTIGKRDLEEVLKSRDYRVQFTEAFRGDNVRSFSPSGIDRQSVKTACGI
jgi:hypothetical protein